MTPLSGDIRYFDLGCGLGLFEGAEHLEVQNCIVSCLSTMQSERFVNKIIVSSCTMAHKAQDTRKECCENVSISFITTRINSTKSDLENFY
jgi:deoxyribose-phosphate aldolase